MKKFLMLLSFNLIFLTSGLGNSEEAKKSSIVVHYFPSKVELVGKIKTEMVYGPPNFEYEPKEQPKPDVKIFLLELKRPFDVQANPNDSDISLRTSFSNVKEIQIYPVLSEKKLKKLFGKSVKVIGTLTTRVSGMDSRDVIMTVKNLKVLN